MGDQLLGENQQLIQLEIKIFQRSQEEYQSILSALEKFGDFAKEQIQVAKLTLCITMQITIIEKTLYIVQKS